MKTFFKPTKGKILLAIPFAFIVFFFVMVVISFFAIGGGELCLPDIPGGSATAPAPAPQPFTVANMVSDIQYETDTDGDGGPCMGNGVTEHTAEFIYNGYEIMYFVFYYLLLPVFGGYFLSSLTLFFAWKVRGNKKKVPRKKKK